MRYSLKDSIRFCFLSSFSSSSLDLMDFSPFFYDTIRYACLPDLLLCCSGGYGFFCSVDIFSLFLVDTLVLFSVVLLLVVDDMFGTTAVTLAFCGGLWTCETFQPFFVYRKEE